MGGELPGLHRAHTSWEARLARRCLAQTGWVRKEHGAHLKVAKLSISRVSSEFENESLRKLVEEIVYLRVLRCFSAAGLEPSGSHRAPEMGP